MNEATARAPRGFHLAPDEGTRLDLPDWRMALKAGAQDTAGALTVIEGTLAPGHPGPAPHVHDGHDECFIVLEGRMRFRIDAGHRTAAAGDTVFAGRGLAHGFANPFPHPVRYVVMLTPSGYEDYFAEVAARIAETGAAPDPVWTAAAMARYGTWPVAAIADPDAKLERS